MVEKNINSNSEDKTVVVRTDTARFHTDIQVRGHKMVADEPASLDGTDHGPTPYDYLLASLGACTTITVRMYADRKGWPLESVVARLNHKRIRASECEQCKTKVGRVDHIDLEVDIIGPLDEAQRTQLAQIVHRCPVHRTLHDEIDIAVKANFD